MWRPGEIIRSPETGITGVCEPPRRCWDLIPGPLQEYQPLSTHWAIFLAPACLFFLKTCLFFTTSPRLVINLSSSCLYLLSCTTPSHMLLLLLYFSKSGLTCEFSTLLWHEGSMHWKDMELWSKRQCHTPLGGLAVAAPIKPRCLGRNCSQCSKLQSLISGGTLYVCLSLSSSPMCVICIWVCCAHDCAGANANTHSSRG